MWFQAIKSDIDHFFREDDLERNFTYIQQLPQKAVRAKLLAKSPLVLAGLPYFMGTFRYLGGDQNFESFFHLEKTYFGQTPQVVLELELPFHLALTGERIALNLLQRASSIATYTQKFVEKAEKYQIKILDTRKTTPGLRALEKYAVVQGGGFNHRMGQTDMWMIKDNHKKFFGGLQPALDFFRSLHGFYTPIEVEIHNLDEFQEVLKLDVGHIMLDNFSPENIHKAVALKKPGMTIEVSGGITLDTIDDYLIEGVDGISIGSLTYGPPSVDLSFKFDL